MLSRQRRRQHPASLCVACIRCEIVDLTTLRTWKTYSRERNVGATSQNNAWGSVWGLVPRVGAFVSCMLKTSVMQRHGHLQCCGPSSQFWFHGCLWEECLFMVYIVCSSDSMAYSRMNYRRRGRKQPWHNLRRYWDWGNPQKGCRES
jgi:hypothetical protein